MSKSSSIQALEPRDVDVWQTVLNRDASADGTFVYAVSSTGIYCRPSCPSRRPRRSLVTFFDTPAEAERAGFRACKRCRPSTASAGDAWTEKVKVACRYLSTVDGHPSLAALARRVGGSPYHLQRNFKRIVGVSPREFAEARRLARVKGALRTGRPVTEAIFDAGYSSGGRFYERAAAKLGMPPATYGKGGAGTSIDYAVVDSPLGRLMVAATARGVCAIAMAATDRYLERALQREYPRARIARDTGRLTGWTAAVLEHLAGRMPRLDLPLDIQATAFEWQVWHALRDIPIGETRSYAAIAGAIGRPGAARAVARACAANPAALAIPCHRVVPSAGGIGGYRWGAARKKQLLGRERPHAESPYSKMPTE